DEGATDEFIRLLAAVGPPEEAIESVRRYRDCGASSPCVGGISGADFDATSEALAKTLDYPAPALAAQHELVAHERLPLRLGPDLGDGQVVLDLDPLDLDARPLPALRRRAHLTAAIFCS